MNSCRKIVVFGFFVLHVGITATVIDGGSDEKSKLIIVDDKRDNVTLPCHPTLQNSTQVLGESDFEWVTDNDVPIYSKGRLSQFLFLDSPNIRYEIANSSLIIHQVSRIIYGNVTFTCRLARLQTNYTYFLQVKPSNTWFPFYHYIGFSRVGETITLPCLTDNDAFASSNYAWISRTYQGNVKDVEVISLNQRIILQNDIAGYRVDEYGSLVIPNFTPSFGKQYECYSSTHSLPRPYASYRVTQTQDDLNEVNDNAKNPSKVRESIAIERGNDVSLNCPPTDSNFVWIRNNTEFLIIKGNAVKNDQSDHFQIDPNSLGKSLLIKNFLPSLTGIYTCVSSIGKSYEYSITEQKSLSQTITVEPGKNITLNCPKSKAQAVSNFAWVRNRTEVLFINDQAVVQSKLDKFNISNSNYRSLVITNFSSSDVGVYACHLTTGINYSYNITMAAHETEPEMKKQTVSVGVGTRRTILPCPKISNDEHATFEWIVERKIAYERLSVLYVNKEKFEYMNPEFYEINDDRSLVILLISPLLFEYGVYTCRWSTGEQYIYNVTYSETHLRNTSVSVNLGDNVTLPCPIEDPRDRELNVIQWVITSPAVHFGYYRFVDGKLLTPLETLYPFPDDLKIADDKQSLIVTNITSQSEGDYYCNLILSNTVFKYSITITGKYNITT